MIKILVIGSGAREHAIIQSLYKSSKKKTIYCLGTNNNPGIDEYCSELLVKNINDPEVVKSYAKEKKINFAIKKPYKIQVVQCFCGKTSLFTNIYYHS